MHPISRALSILALAAASAAPAAAGVLLVDSMGGGAFTTIQAAVNASADGDIVLVKIGNYAPFMVGDRAIAIVSDSIGGAHVNGTIHVAGLSAGKTVVLDGLVAKGVYSTNEPNGYGLRVFGCAGHVRAQNCSFTGSNGNPNPLFNCTAVGIVKGWDGALAENCSDVGFTRCVLQGGNASNLFEFPECDGDPQTGDPGGNGLRAKNSIVSVYDGLSAGGAGGTAWYYGGAGGAGIALDGASLVASAGTMKGGNGGSAWDYFGLPMPGGGAAGLAIDSTSVGRTLGATFQSGVGGQSLAGTAPSAPPVFSAGTYVVLPGSPKNFLAPAVLREMQSDNLQIQGNAGETAFLFLSIGTDATWAPSLKGMLLLSGASLLGPYGFGTLPGSGSILAPIVGPNLPASVLGAEIWMQMVVAGPGGGTLSAGKHVTLLDASL